MFFSAYEQYEGAALLFQHVVNPAEWDTTVSYLYAWKVIGPLVLREKQTVQRKKVLFFGRWSGNDAEGIPGNIPFVDQ